MNILFIGLDYYNYAKEISNEMENAGHSVNFYPIEPRSLYYKVSRYIAKNAYRRSLDAYHKAILESTRSESYDVVFFITTHFLSDSSIRALRAAQPSARFIAYHWDSVHQYNYLHQLEHFDAVFSFDKDDCVKYGVKYLPLFASGEFLSIEQTSSKKEIEVYTVSSIVNPARYQTLNKISKFLSKNGIRHEFFMKVTPITYFRILMKGNFPSGVSFRAISKSRMRDLVENSNSALDVTNHQQSGLTMRVIENTHIGKKVITTNDNVKRESFFNSKQCHILDLEKLEDLLVFLKADYEPKKVNELSISYWVSQVLS